MPRETIRIHSNEADIFDIKVGWTKDQYMQIGLEHFEHRSLISIFFNSDDAKKMLGREVRGLVLDAKADATQWDDKELGERILKMLENTTSGSHPSIWTSPSRHEVNELIRLLRRARDSAFGRDE